MARKPNYDFEKRQRELRKKEKKAAKAEAKRAAAAARKDAGDDDPSPLAPGQRDGDSHSD